MPACLAARQVGLPVQSELAHGAFRFARVFETLQKTSAFAIAFAFHAAIEGQ